jgi:hypothetical protein
MRTIHRYRQYAEDCEALAQNIRDKMERQILLNIAGQFRRLANYKERRKGGMGVKGPLAADQRPS